MIPELVAEHGRLGWLPMFRALGFAGCFLLKGPSRVWQRTSCLQRMGDNTFMKQADHGKLGSGDCGGLENCQHSGPRFLICL